MVTKFELANLSRRKRTDLMGIRFDLSAQYDFFLEETYAKGLHAWFLNQIRDYDPEFSAYLHDQSATRPFSMSRLNGESLGDNLQLIAGKRYKWFLHCFSQGVTDTVLEWLGDVRPSVVLIGTCELAIERVSVSLQPYCYLDLLQITRQNCMILSFLSPTVFRVRGAYLPLPMPRNVFHSYLRRWNAFSKFEVDLENFLDWVDDFVVIRKHRLATQRVGTARKSIVTGFLGSVQFAVRSEGLFHEGYVHLFSVLGFFAPYCGTGSKTTYGLGFTLLSEVESPTSTFLEKQL
ncbi:CRISPR-associated protein, Cas6 family [[Leptolyngbya] sp. PCC 7376]|uniref:CRISPR-associated endoribonuclease Cas6 n=1 Tax=[Leptolyngbya] sp. PCC 7376 TaxID=111781 RepID=UPI00029F4AA4|nr:CRISPR-associated endoribonuclease Cas6 [[Leptolyngbya] sp. PCC 7376]AFY38651.1 CRISPR-associated protein, Cas6 family [[Leptolyngbya] sp. PCC 7376]